MILVHAHTHTNIYIIIIINYYLSFRVEFFTSVLADGFSLEFEWPQVSRTCLRILAVLSNAVIWIVSTRPPTSKSPRLFNNPLVIVSNAPITTGTIITFMFHSFFNSLALSFRFILWSAGTAKSTIFQIFFFFVDYYKVWSSDYYFFFKTTIDHIMIINLFPSCWIYIYLYIYIYI